jgi:signal transduction histidine kinase
MERWLETFARANFLRSSDTAHDLKTPLNVAVLNLELLRMRLRKLSGDDEKVAAYARAIEVELRRMARIFDTFFILSTPPKEGEPAAVDLIPICAEYELAVDGPSVVLAHEPRIRQAFKMFFDGAAKVLQTEGRRVAVDRDRNLRITISGYPVEEDLELTKVFKFYYTDSEGNPDLSLAAARLIAETYGGELNGVQESDKVITLQMSLPLGEE